MDIKKMFKKAVASGASDLHLVVGVPPTLRVNGQLQFIDDEAVVSAPEMEKMIFSMINDKQQERFRAARELDFGYALEEYRFRVNVHFEKNNMGLVARVITQTIPTLDDLEMPKMIFNLLDLKQGLILLTGPTGCGKSTALAAMIDYINQNRFCNIITLEDPIEYLFKPKKSIIIQRQLGADMLSFAEGLKHALRQDPNVIMVGEMRDLETIGTTVTLAETGHLVLATLHTYNAAQTVDRIIDIFPPHQQNQIRQQLSSILAAVISQRLIPATQGGRMAAREIMINTPAISNMIREGKTAQISSVLETSSRDGMHSMDQDIKRLFNEGKIGLEEAQAYMENPSFLEKGK